MLGTRNGNRTHNYPLGGGCYIHLTMQANMISPTAAVWGTVGENIFIQRQFFPKIPQRFREHFAPFSLR